MLVIAVAFFVTGIVLVILSRYRGDYVGRFVLPPGEARRVWLPGGLLLNVLGALLVVMFTTTLPSSPLRQAETRAIQTRVQESTLGVHTAYFIAHTQQAFLQIGSLTYTPPVMITPLAEVNYSDFELTSTMIHHEASSTAANANAAIRATNRARALATIEDGDAIAMTATENRTRVTATPTFTPTPTLQPSRAVTFRTPTPRNSSLQTDFEQTATALIEEATRSRALEQTVQAAAAQLTENARAVQLTAAAGED
ncbi:MAG: hypothetical protein AAF653_07415 [Chloroflexota bacterium]